MGTVAFGLNFSRFRCRYFLGSEGFMEAAIGIEPMDKGFAVQKWGILQSATYCHPTIK